jgi:hypothetical protein
VDKCRIRCEHCKAWFSSPLQFGNAEAFFTCTLVGNLTQCPSCGRMSGCNKENMRYADEKDEQGFVGNDTV